MTELSLRKASALEKGLQAAAAKLTLPTSVSVSVYDSNTDETLATAAETLAANIEKQAVLVKAAYDIRNAIGVASNEVGISGLLAERMALESTERSYNTVLASAKNYVLPTTVKARLDTLKRRLETSERYSREEDVTAGVVSPELEAKLTNLANAVRRRKVEIADKLDHLNRATKITISEEIATLAKEFVLL